MTGEDDRRGDGHVPALLQALREGWHGLGGGDAAACPGCPVCRLGESAGRMDPATAQHLQSAASHLASAGRELLAALAARPDPATGPADSPTDGPADGPATGPAATGALRPDPPDGTAPRSRADVPPAPARTTIHVDTDPTSPVRGTEEQA